MAQGDIYLMHGERALVMGVVNVTPDSFSDGGKYAEPEAAVERAHEMMAEGVDVLDVGAESTRPGHAPLTWEEEWARLEPVLRQLLPVAKVPISVDTYHPETAMRAVECGVWMVNDISMCANRAMIDCLTKNDAAYVLMHNRSSIDRHLTTADFVRELTDVLNGLLEAGVQANRIWLDPGVGFGKTQSQNLMCIQNVDAFAALGYPILLGTSRKRVIGNVLDLPVGERLEGTLATVAYGVLKGAKMLRVHDVKETVRMCRMLEAIQFADKVD